MNSLNELGKPVGQTLSDILRSRGLLTSDSQISLTSLREIIENLMGEAAADILMEQIILELDRLVESQ